MRQKSSDEHLGCGSSSRDTSQLADLVDAVADQLELGQSVDIDSLVGLHPDLAQPLRAAYESLVGLHAAADSHPTDEGIRLRQLGDFQLAGELGRGGMGIVYEAEQISLDRRVAIKVLPFAGLLDGRQLARFKNEARAAAMLKHPGIVSVYSISVERGVHYYAMELIEGKSLAEVVANLFTEPSALAAGRGDEMVCPPAHVHLEVDGSPPSPDASAFSSSAFDTVPLAALSTQRLDDRKEFFRTVARLGVQAASALHYAHQQGVIHRDIKPSNLLVDHDGNIQITDFGLARIHSGDDLTMTGDIVGTLRYMSPEQLDEDAVPDQRTDIYSLGLSLYELATGKAAFDATRREQLLRQVQQGEPPPPSHWDCAIPRDLEKILLKSIAARPDERYTSARAFRDDLQRFLDHKPVQARRISRLRRSWRWCLRHRSRAALIGVLSTLLLTLAIGGPMVAWNQASIAARQRHVAYDADMASAHQYIEHGEIDQAIVLLRKYLPEKDGGPADYRSFEYYEMAARCRRRLEATEIRLSFPVWGLATSPTGEIAVGPYDAGPVVFDGTTGQQKWPAMKDPNLAMATTGLAYSSDGRFLFSASQDKMLRIWDTETGQMAHAERLEERPSCVAVNAQGIVAVGMWGKLAQGFPQTDPAPILRFRFAEVSEKEISLERLPPLSGAIGVAHDIAMTPDGKRLASSSEDGIMRIWNLETGEVDAEFADFRGPVMAVAFSPDGTRVCGAGGVYEREWLSGEAVVYNLESKTQVTAVFSDDVIYSVAFATNDEMVTGGVDRRISVWSVANGTLREQINAHADSIRRLAVYPGERRIASGSDDNTVRIWDLDQSVAPRRITAPESMMDIIDLAFSKDGSRLASASADRGIRIWNPQDGTLIRLLGRHRYWAHGVDYSPDGTKLASISSEWPYDQATRSEIKIWDLTTNQADTFDIDNMSYGRSIAYAPSGEHVAIVGDDRLVLWSVAEKTIERERKIDGGFHVVFSRDGSLIGSVAGVWKYPSLEEVFSLGRSLDSYEFAFDIHPTGEYVAASDTQTHDVVLLSAKDGSEICRFPGHNEIVLHLHFSYDGKRLVSSSQAGLVILWDLETGNEVLRYRDHSFWVWAAYFSPDDRILASCQAGRYLPATIMVRRTVTNEEVRSILDGGRQRTNSRSTLTE